MDDQNKTDETHTTEGERIFNQMLRKQVWTVGLLWIATFAAFYIPVIRKMTDLGYLLSLIAGVTVLTMLSRFPHEYCHAFAARFFGYETRINFKRLNPNCEVLSPVPARRYLYIIVAPLVATLLMSFSALIVAALFGLQTVFDLTVGYMLLYLPNFSGDIVWAFHVLKNPKASFLDRGDFLIVVAGAD